MICNERSTRILPGLSQALDWLRQNLPPAPHPPIKLAPIAVPARTPRHRSGGRHVPARYRQD